MTSQSLQLPSSPRPIQTFLTTVRTTRLRLPGLLLQRPQPLPPRRPRRWCPLPWQISTSPSSLHPAYHLPRPSLHHPLQIRLDPNLLQAFRLSCSLVVSSLSHPGLHQQSQSEVDLLRALPQIRLSLLSVPRVIQGQGDLRELFPQDWQPFPAFPYNSSWSWKRSCKAFPAWQQASHSLRPRALTQQPTST